MSSEGNTKDDLLGLYARVESKATELESTGRDLIQTMRLVRDVVAPIRALTSNLPASGIEPRVSAAPLSVGGFFIALLIGVQAGCYLRRLERRTKSREIQVGLISDDRGRVGAESIHRPEEWAPFEALGWDEEIEEFDRDRQWAPVPFVYQHRTGDSVLLKPNGEVARVVFAETPKTEPFVPIASSFSKFLDEVVDSAQDSYFMFDYYRWIERRAC